MPEYKNQLLTSFVGRVDASFKKSVNEVSSSLSSLTGTTKQLTTSTKALAATGKTAQSSAKSMNTFATSTKGVASALQTLLRFSTAGLIIRSFTQAIMGSVRAIVEFDQSLKSLQAITGASNIEVGLFGDKILEVSNSTKFSATEVASAMQLLGQAGFTATESLQSIDAVAALATGTLTDFATTADLFTTTIRAFNLETSQSSKVADIFAISVNRSKLTVDKLRTAFNFVGAAAAQAGVSLEETASLMQLLANNGLRASTIGTGLRNILSRLVAPNNKLKLAVAALGISLDSVNPSIVGIQAAMQNLLPVLMDVKTGTVDTGMAYELFGLRGQQAAAILAKEFQSGGFALALEKTQQAGEATRQQIKQQQGLGVEIKNLSDRWKNLAVLLGDAGLTTAIRGIVFVFSELALVLQKVTQAFIDLQEFISAKVLNDTKTQTEQVIKQSAAYDDTVVGIERYLEALQSVTASGEDNWETQEEISNILDSLVAKYPELSKVVKNYDGDLEHLIETLRGVEEAYQKKSSDNLVQGLSESRKQMGEVAASMEDLSARRELLTRRYKDGLITEEIYNQNLKIIAEGYSAASERLKKLQYQTTLYQKQLAKIGEGVSDPLIDRLEQEKKALENAGLAGDRWASFLSQLGSAGQTLWKEVLSTGNQSLISNFVEGAKKAVAELEDINANIDFANRSTDIAQAQADVVANLRKKLFKEQEKEQEKSHKKLLREQEELYKDRISNEKAQFAATKAGIETVATLEESAIIQKQGTEREKLKLSAKTLKQIYDAELKSYDQRVKILRDFESATGESKNEEYQTIMAQRAKIDAEYTKNAIELEDKLNTNRLEHPENLKEAWDAAMHSIKEKTKTSWEEVRDVMVNAIDSFAETSASAFIDFVKGTKSAADAFSDMALSIIEDLTKMIIKQQIFNLISAGAESLDISGLFGGGSESPASTLVNTYGYANASSNHSGGMAGKASSIRKNLDPSSFINAPRFHSGGEVPAVLKTGEEVLTREQAASNRENKPVSVQIINKGQEAKSATATSSINMGEQIITVVLDAMEYNKNGMRTKIASIR